MPFFVNYIKILILKIIFKYILTLFNIYILYNNHCLLFKYYKQLITYKALYNYLK